LAFGGGESLLLKILIESLPGLEKTRIILGSENQMATWPQRRDARSIEDFGSGQYSFFDFLPEKFRTTS